MRDGSIGGNSLDASAVGAAAGGECGVTSGGVFGEYSSLGSSRGQWYWSAGD